MPQHSLTHPQTLGEQVLWTPRCPLGCFSGDIADFETKSFIVQLPYPSSQHPHLSGSMGSTMWGLQKMAGVTTPPGASLRGNLGLKDANGATLQGPDLKETTTRGTKPCYQPIPNAQWALSCKHAHPQNPSTLAGRLGQSSFDQVGWSFPLL
jgi:hypothetical protein